MNIITIIIMMALVEYYDKLPDNRREARRAATETACVRRRNTAMDALGDGLLDGKIRVRALPAFDREETNMKVSHRYDTYYFKERSFMYNGRVHVGDRHRKGKRPYKEEREDKIRYAQAMKDLYS